MYWTPQGRQSVDAVLVATVIGLLLLVGANPLGEGSGEGERVAARWWTSSHPRSRPPTPHPTVARWFVDPGEGGTTAMAPALS